MYFCATFIGSSVPPSSGRNTNTYSGSMLWNRVMMSGWNNPNFLLVAGLHAIALIRTNASNSRSRLCTIRFNVESSANRQNCRIKHVTQNKQEFFHCTKTICLHLTTHPRIISLYVQNSRYKSLWGNLDSGVALSAVKSVKQGSRPTFRTSLH
jgi:hypothetical protein